MLAFLACGKSKNNDQEVKGCSNLKTELFGTLVTESSIPPVGANTVTPLNTVCTTTTANCEPKDEDPSPLQASNGKVFLAWMSNRSLISPVDPASLPNDDIYLMYTADSVQWSELSRVTQHPDADWYPTLLEHSTSRGNFHMSWMRQEAQAPYSRHIYFNSSSDGIHWDAANEVAVTSGLVDDFLPYLFERNGKLYIYFDNLIGRSTTGTRDIFYTVSADGGNTWSAPVQAIGINSPDEMDSFAFVGPKAGSSDLLMTWIRFDSTATSMMGFLDSSTDVYTSTSNDGVHWTPPMLLTPGDNPDTAVDTMPSFFRTSNETFITWVKNISNSGHIVELPLSNASSYPEGLVDTTLTNNVPGYSPRVVATLIPHVYVRVWVGNDKRIYFEVFNK